MNHLSNSKIAIVKARVTRGDRYADIATDYCINQGRIADIKYGRIGKAIAPAIIIDARTTGSLLPD